MRDERRGAVVVVIFGCNAAEVGHLGVFQWALDNRLPWDWRMIQWAAVKTSADGRFRIVEEELLKRARDDRNLEWSVAQWEGLAKYAALYGHLRVSKRVIGRGECAMSGRIYYCARIKKDPETLKWLRREHPYSFSHWSNSIQLE